MNIEDFLSTKINFVDFKKGKKKDLFEIPINTFRLIIHKMNLVKPLLRKNHIFNLNSLWREVVKLTSILILD